MTGTPPPPPPPPPSPPPSGSGSGMPGVPPPPPYGFGPPGYGVPGVPSPGFGAPGYPQATRTNGMAIASLVLGLLSIPLCFFFLPAVLAVVFGGVGISQCNRDRSFTGKGMAIAGLVLGLVSVTLIVLLIAIGNTTGDLELR